MKPPFKHANRSTPKAQQLLAKAQASMAEGLSFHQQGKLDKAQQRYMQVLRLQPENFDALHLMGVLASQSQQPQRAVELITQALRVNPRVAGAFINLGVALRQLKQYQAAVEAYDQALRLEPEDVDTLINRGVSLRALHQHTQAMESYNQALALQPKRAEALYNRALLFNDLNRLPEAIADFEATLCAMPHYHPARWGQTLCHLQAGHLALGWQNYEVRWLQDEKEFTTPSLVTTKPKWRQGDHPSRLLLWPEQGVGDELMWGGLLQQAKACADQLLVQLDVRLIPLFQRVMPDVLFLPKGTHVDETLYDAHLPLGDLAGLFCQEFSDFQNIQPRYVSADPARVQALRADLSNSDSRPLCGISWQSKNDKRGQDRSMALLDFVQAIGPDQVRFVNLQYGDVRDEIAQLKSVHGLDVIECEDIDNFQDLDGLSALIEACDWVVSVDNSTVHLAGALGKPVWVLLPFNADWRWFLNRSDSPWYRSATLYRQTAIADWSSVISQIRSDVQTRCQQLYG